MAASEAPRLLELEGESADRARVYRALAALFRRPEAASLRRLRERELPEGREALRRLRGAEALERALAEVADALAAAEPGEIRRAYERTFEPSGGLRCSPHETSHTAETAAHQMNRTYEMADVAGFYRAFGVEVAPGGERADHVAAELEFLHLLAVKAAVARAEEGEGAHLEVCRDAARSFLRDHVAPFAPRLAGCLEAKAAHPLYAAAGRALEGFVAMDAAALGAA